MEASIRAPGERARTLGISTAGRGGWSTTQPQELRRLLSLCSSGEGETVCCVLHVASELSSRVRRTVVCVWLSVSMGPAVA